MNKSQLIADNIERLFMGSIYKWQFLDNDCSIRVDQSFLAIFQKYYAGIMLNAFSDLLCSKLCWHNRLVPTVIVITVTNSSQTHQFSKG